MAFLAIVHAPALRSGARLCISDLTQTADKPPTPIAPGAEIDLRFGTCCPDSKAGAIGLCDTDSEEAVLRVGNEDWHIRRARAGGVRTPGIIADDWFVVLAER